jgi:hypothetical protein
MVGPPRHVADPFSALPIRSRLLLEPFLKEALPPARVSLASVGTFTADGDTHLIPRLSFRGPPDGGDTLRIGLFAGMHGDDRYGPEALTAFFRRLEADPSPARGYHLFGYPILNPAGFEAHRNTTAGGHDLATQIWKGSPAPEAYFIENELRSLRFHGVVSLLSAPRAGGLHAYVCSSVLEKNLVWPAIRAAERFLPSQPAEDNVSGCLASVPGLTPGVRGILTHTPDLAPAPFEILLETPRQAPRAAQIEGLVVALHTVLRAYEALQAHRAHL